MADIGFYHLTRTGALQALPRLLGRTLAAGQRALVLCPDPARLSTALWDSQDPPWLPHGTPAQHAGAPGLQPIWVTDAPGPAPNGARFLFLLDGAPHQPGFDRTFDLFDGNDPAALAAARQRWTAAKAAGHKLTYWQQGPRGWTAKA